MTRKVARKWLIVLVVISLAACRAEQELTRTIPRLTVPAETSTERPVILPSSTPFNTPPATVTVLPATVASWSTYVFAEGISVEYPTGWIVIPAAFSDVDFSSTAEKYDPLLFTVRVEVSLRPIADGEITDPHSWEDNEGGYKVHWEKPISVEGAEGLEFVWGVIQHGEWWTRPSLQAVYSSELYDLDVRLTTYFARENIELAKMVDLPESIATRVTVFEHMVQSVRFNQ